MLDKLSAVLHLTATDDWTSVMGEVPDGKGLATLKEMAQERPAARKFAGGMAVTVPLGAAGWHFWILSGVLGVTELPAVMARLQDLSRGISGLEGSDAGSSASAPDGDQTADVIAKVVARLGDTQNVKPKALAPLILDSLIELGQAESGAVLKWSGRRKPKVWISDERLYGKSDELSSVCLAMQTAEPEHRRVTVDDAEDDVLEIALLARGLDSKSAVVVLPPKSEQGYGLIAFGGSTMEIAPLLATVDMMRFKFPPSKIIGKPMRTLRRIGFLAAMVATGFYLAQPTSTILTTVGTTIAADVTSVTLPSDAYLARMHVRVGDSVEAGDIIGEFTSRSIEDAIAEERLNASVENLTAQAALADNDYATFQLANQRLEIAQERITQLTERQAELTVAAPTAGRVISAMSDSVSGLFGSTGQEIAQLQTSEAMRVQMELSRMDARLVGNGMTGTAYFRGLSQRSFDVAVDAQPAVYTNPETGENRIETKARVADPDGLIVGMTGFMRLNGPDAPRYKVWSRHVSEFIREKSWTYLGLHL